VIQLRTQDVFPSALESLLVKLLGEYEAQLEAGALLVAEPARHRVRILPLKP